MLSINREQYPSRQNLIMDYRFSPSSLRFESPCSNSFSPSFVSYSSNIQSQFIHDPFSSPFMPTLSENKQTPTDSIGKNAPRILITPFETLMKNISTESKELHLIPANIIPCESSPGKCKSSSTTTLLKKDDLGLLRKLTNVQDENIQKDIVPILRYKGVKKTRAEKAAENRSGEFACKYCTMTFKKSQGLGGHMSRAHPGKSQDYNRKKSVRKNREIERARLCLAKRKFFNEMNCDYDKLIKTKEGRKVMQSLIKRNQLKKIKRKITKEEIDNFIEEEAINEIREDLSE